MGLTATVPTHAIICSIHDWVRWGGEWEVIVDPRYVGTGGAGGLLMAKQRSDNFSRDQASIETASKTTQGSTTL